MHVSQATWFDLLGIEELSINSAVLDSTGLSPAHVVYGAPLRLPVDQLDGFHPVEAAQTEVASRE